MKNKKQIFKRVLTLFLPLLLAQSATAQSCSLYISNEWTDDRYLVHDNGTVTDQGTNLMWKQCSEGLSGETCTQGTQTFHNWQDALGIPEILNADTGFAGHNDWRLPNIKELQSLASYNCTAPALNISIFPVGVFEPVNPYWSNSPAKESALRTDGRSWVFTDDGGISTFLRTSNNKIRLVRTLP